MVTTKNELLVPATDMNEFQPRQVVAAKYPEQVTESSILWLIRNQKRNGFNRCIRRIGNRNMIHIPSLVAFFANGGVQT